VPIEINACWTSFGDPLILGSSRAVSYHGNFTGAPVTNTWYQVSLANALNGTDLNDTDGPDSDGDGFDADADMNIKYNKDRTDWYFGIDGSPGGSELDFASVALHEICHGLGFAGSMIESSGQGYWGWGITSYPTIYDHFTERGGSGTGTPLLSYTKGSTQLGSALTSQDIFFDGPNTNAANGGTPPELYAPPIWQPGSSYSHLDESYNDTANALMTYSIGPGESEHSPGSVTFGILQDVGWNTVTYPDVGIVKQVVGGSDLVPGDPITFTLSIANSGGVVAANTVVTDVVPSEVLTPTFASTLAVTQTGVISCVWNIEPLGVGESGVITIYGWIDPSLDSDSSFDNTATISDPEDNTPGNNTSSVTVGVRKVYLPLVVKNWPPILTEKFYAVADTTVLQGFPTTNFGSVVDMWVGYDHCIGGEISRSLAQFDLSGIPSGATVNQARLYLYLMNSCDIGERTHTATVYRVNSSWSSSSVTWNTKPGYAEAYGSASIPSATWGWYSFDATNLVRGWVNGSFSDYGLMIRGPESSGTSSARLGFATLNQSGTTYDPYLEITYVGTTALGFESQVPAAGEIPNVGECGPAVTDMLGVFPGIPGYGMFEAVGEVTCSPD
jgi:uncharacterized repeat protein (TIGR01451 family)